MCYINAQTEFIKVHSNKFKHSYEHKLIHKHKRPTSHVVSRSVLIFFFSLVEQIKHTGFYFYAYFWEDICEEHTLPQTVFDMIHLESINIVRRQYILNIYWLFLTYTHRHTHRQHYEMMHQIQIHLYKKRNLFRRIATSVNENWKK